MIVVAIRMVLVILVIDTLKNISIDDTCPVVTGSNALIQTSTTPLVAKGRYRWPSFATEDDCDGICDSIVDYEDTVRVRIWRALASLSGEEVTLKQLGMMVGERRIGELKSHLQHVKRQAKTLKNKKTEWKERRGLLNADKLRIRIRRGKNNDICVRLK